MAIKIPLEYDDSGFDFGFSAVADDTEPPKPIVTTQEIVQPVNDEIIKLTSLVNNIYQKLDSLEEIVKAGSGSFDVDAYKSLLDKEASEKLKALEGLIMPLLVNLMKSPEKDMIKWPNRKPVIEAQISKILAITRPNDA